MATLEERIGRLEETLLKDLSEPFREVMLKVDENSRDLQGVRVRLETVGMGLDMMDSCIGTIDRRLETVDARLNGIESKIDHMNKKLDQVLTLLMQGR
jgi:hypothetical protein